jgi:hypothetical protein
VGKRMNKIIIKNCFICGKPFTVKIRKSDNHIISKCFHSYINKHIFLGWNYEIISFEPFKTKIRFKNKFYKIIGFNKFSREIYYFLWKLFHNQKIEYWECKQCCEEAEKK